MDIAELRTKLDNIAAELAEQDVQQEEVAIEEHHEKDEDGNVIPHDEISEEEIAEEEVEERKSDREREEEYKNDPLYSLMIGGPADKGIAKLPRMRKEDEMEEEAVEEATVEIPVQELADIMQLAGYANYAERIEEYANEPAEDYGSVEDQMIGLSGGLNGPKSSYAAAAGGDNAMAQEPTEIEEDSMASVEEQLYKSYKDFLEEAEIKKED